MTIELKIDRPLPWLLGGIALAASLGLHAQPDARVVRAQSFVLEDASANPRLDVLAAAGLEDDGVDPCAVQELREREARGAGADDRDLRPVHAASRSKSAACPWPTPTHIVAMP